MRAGWLLMLVMGHSTAGCLVQHLHACECLQCTTSALPQRASG